MYNVSLNIGNQISIYTDYKEEIGYEGEAVLVEKLSIGDTFFLVDEFVDSDPEMSNTPNKKKSVYNEKLNSVFENLDNQPKEAKKFFREILLVRKNKIDDYNNMLKVVLKWKDLAHKKYLSKSYDHDDRFKRVFREIPTDYIVRYFQQFKKKINNTIFRYEKWRVEFVIDNCGYTTNYTAIKKIRVIVKNNYKDKNGESELINYTTYNGKKLTK